MSTVESMVNLLSPNSDTMAGDLLGVSDMLNSRLFGLCESRGNDDDMVRLKMIERREEETI